MKQNPLVRADGDYTLNSDYPLFKEQQEAVHFLVTHMNSVLALPPGGGKSYTILTALAHVQTKFPYVKGIIVCPKGALTIFKKELSQKLYTDNFSVLSSDIQQINPHSNILLVSASSLKQFLPEVVSFINNGKSMLIIDEAHSLQNQKSQFYQNMTKLRAHVSATWLVTATPLLNHMEGLYNIVSYARPGYLGTYWQFSDRYLQIKERTLRNKRKIREVIGYKNLDELKQKIDAISFMKKTPYNLVFHYRKSQLSREEKDAYNEASAGILSKEYQDKAKEWGARLHDLQRVVDNSYEGYIIPYLSHKEELLLKTLKEVFNRNEAVLIYLEYEDTVNRLRDMIKKYQSSTGMLTLHEITGKVSFEDRVYVQKNLKPREAVIITRAGSQSLNLQKANNIIYYDIPFSVGQFIQACGRIARVDTEYDTQNVYILEAEGTIDTYKRKLIEDHATLIRDLFGESENLPKDIQALDRSNMNKLRRALLWNKK